MTRPLHLLVLTTVARSVHADVTVASLRRHHPEAPITVVVVDDRFGEVRRARRDRAAEGELWRTVADDELGPQSVDPQRRRAELLLAFTPEERLAVLRPAVLRTVAAAASGGVVVLVPDDTGLLASLDPLVDLVRSGVRGPAGAVSLALDGSPVDADRASSVADPDRASALDRVATLALVPVRMSSVPRDGRLPDTADHLALGRFDRDLLAVDADAADPFLRWWSESVADNPLDAPDRFDPVRHAWLDEAEVLFDAARLPGGLVRSYRNVDETGDLDQGDVMAVRFPGFEPARPWVLSDLAGLWPRVLLSANPALERIVRARTESLIVAARQGAPKVADPTRRLPDGHAVDPTMRRIYRAALMAARRHGTVEPPNGFVSRERAAFRDWLAEPVRGRIGRYLAALQQDRADLASMFAGDDGAFELWASSDAQRAGVWVPAARAPEVAANSDDAYLSPAHRGETLRRTEVVARDRSAPTPGLNLIGLLSAQLGIGEYGRLFARTVRDARIPFSVVDHDDTVNERDPALLAALGADGTGLHHDVDMLLVNADQTPKALARYGRAGRSERPTIGLWAWETQRFPTHMHAALDLVDEVWVPSEFVRDAIGPAAAAHGVEVRTFPIQLPATRPSADRSITGPLVAELGIDPSRPLFAFLFDYFSIAERKQPWAVVDAYLRAFPEASADAPQLVIKSINAAFFPLDVERLRHVAAGRPDITIVDGYLPAAARDALIAHADGYVSLHRSEGLGLTLAEAMAVGTPAIATGWSGNLAFMNDANSVLVPSTPVVIGPEVPVYALLGEWAEPDLDAAAAAMRDVIENPQRAGERAERARADIDARNRSGADVDFLLDRLRAVRTRNARRRSGERL